MPSQCCSLTFIVNRTTPKTALQQCWVLGQNMTAEQKQRWMTNYSDLSEAFTMQRNKDGWAGQEDGNKKIRLWQMMWPEYPPPPPSILTHLTPILQAVCEKNIFCFICPEASGKWHLYLQLVIKLPLEPSPPITSMLPSNFRSGGGPAFLGLPV